MIGGGAITWVTLAMLATAESASAHAMPDGRLPPVIVPPYEGVTGRARQALARERARKKKRKAGR
jgi:hypothetical protein